MWSLNKFRSCLWAGVLLWIAVLPVSARDINVRGMVTNVDGEPLYRVSIYNAGSNTVVGVTN